MVINYRLFTRRENFVLNQLNVVFMRIFLLTKSFENLSQFLTIKKIFFSDPVSYH
jgi:hypothetical protein